MFIEIAIAAVALGAFLDGWSTNYAIARGNHEVDPVMVRIFGTNRPTAKTIFVRGALVISAESAVAVVASHWLHWFGLALLVQAGVHIYEAVKNFKVR
jgi:hypothetical protein